jgi:hypothetical protein
VTTTWTAVEERIAWTATEDPSYQFVTLRPTTVTLESGGDGGGAVDSVNGQTGVVVLDAADVGAVDVALVGAPDGVAELDSGGLVPSSQLPSYVDDVIEAANFAALPGTGATGKIYVTLDNNLTFRWSGSAYVEISASLALGETSSTAYRGDRGKTAYDHSQVTTGNPHGTTASDVGAAATSHAHSGTDITSGLVAPSVLGTGGAGAGAKFLADDQTFKTPPTLGAVLSNVTLTGTQTTISFTSIPSTYTHLVIVFQGRSNAAGVATTGFRMTLNNDTGSNYNGQFVGGNNTTAYAAIQTAAAFGYLGEMPAATATSGYSSSGTIEIPNYMGTTFFKNAMFATTRDTNGAGVNMVAYRGHIVWKSTTAISRIDLFPQFGDFIAGSCFTLYGIV